MVSATATSSTRDFLKDQLLTFNCYQFSRGVRATRPLSRRWVSAGQCLCTHDPDKICDPSRLYDLHFNESSDEEAANELKEINERFPDIPPDRIGVFNPDGEMSFIYVPPHFMDVLWSAAIAADGVLRSVSLTAQPQGERRWAVFEATLNERIAEPFELPIDKSGRPKAIPPRANPVVAELRALRALSWGRLLPGVIIIAAGVLIALWIAKLWR